MIEHSLPLLIGSSITCKGADDLWAEIGCDVQIRKSLGTDQCHVAEIKSLEIVYEAQARVRISHKVKTRTFEQVANEYIDHIRAKVTRQELKEYHGIKSPAVSSNATSPSISGRTLMRAATSATIRPLVDKMHGASRLNFAVIFSCFTRTIDTSIKPKF